MTEQTTAERIHAEAFAEAREPRSDAYRAGVLYGLRSQLDEPNEPCPYVSGSAERDAYYAGVSEGARLAWDHPLGAEQRAARAAK